jgi:hypothetical protein
LLWRLLHNFLSLRFCRNNMLRLCFLRFWSPLLWLRSLAVHNACSCKSGWFYSAF